MDKEATARVLHYLEKNSDRRKNGDLSGDRYLDSIGMDSLDKLELALNLEDEFDISISDEEFAKLDTVQHLLDLVEELRR